MEKSCTIQDVFERFYPSYEKRNNPPAHHRKTAYHIMNCKTGVFGVNISVCEDCGCISIHNNSCRSRCCPMCQAFPKEKWIDAQKENVLDAPYYHVVFTVPEELNSIIYSNQKLLYDALYHAASATLNELAKDVKYLGANIGYICILHTWGSAMNSHSYRLKGRDFVHQGKIEIDVNERSVFVIIQGCFFVYTNSDCFLNSLWNRQSVILLLENTTITINNTDTGL